MAPPRKVIDIGLIRGTETRNQGLNGMPYQEESTTRYDLLAYNTNRRSACFTTVNSLSQEKLGRSWEMGCRHSCNTGSIAIAFRSLRNRKKCSRKEDCTAVPCKCTSSCVYILEGAVFVESLGTIVKRSRLSDKMCSYFVLQGLKV